MVPSVLLFSLYLLAERSGSKFHGTLFLSGNDGSLLAILGVLLAALVVAVAALVAWNLVRAVRHSSLGRQCPGCHGTDIRPSWPKGWMDKLMEFCSCVPYRCRACRLRHYRFRQSGDPAVAEREDPARASVLPVSPPPPPTLSNDRLGAAPLFAIDSNALPWEERFNEKLGRALFRKNLIIDPDTGMEVRLVRYPSGVVNPRHTHPCAHGMYVLEGQLFTHAGVYGPGSFVWFPEGSVMEHGSANGQDVTVLFITNKPFHIHYR